MIQSNQIQIRFRLLLIKKKQRNISNVSLRLKRFNKKNKGQIYLWNHIKIPLIVPKTYKKKMIKKRQKVKVYLRNHIKITLIVPKTYKKKLKKVKAYLWNGIIFPIIPKTTKKRKWLSFSFFYDNREVISMIIPFRR